MVWTIAEMIPWTIPETVTAGFVVVAALGLIYKFLGQRTDPKLLELFKLQTEATSKRDEDNAEVNGRLADSLDALAQSIQQMVLSNATEYQTQLAAIGAIPGVIMPSIKTLTQQLEDQRGSVQTMTDTVEDQNGTIQQILEAVLRLESKIGIFQIENQRLGIEIKEAKEELVAIKGDVSKLKPIPKPKPPGVPVTPKPTDKTEQEKTE